MNIIAVHLLNDYSGSPKVLMQLLKAWNKKNMKTHIYTCAGSTGFLSNIPNVEQHYYWYQFAKNPFIRLLYLIWSQIILAVKLLNQLEKSDILYINTVLPFGAGVAGKMVGCKVIYHIHETSIKPMILKRFLFGIVKWSATEVVYVSKYLANNEPINTNTKVLYNVLEQSFVSEAKQNLEEPKKGKIILMICSLKGYKGVDIFLRLAKMNQHLIFKLVVNAGKVDIDNYFKNEIIPNNLLIYPTQKDTHPFYREASILLNLSDINLWVETFGLTVLEAMAYGLPSVVPTIGGITELVEDGVNGFLVDSKNIILLNQKINYLLTNAEVYARMRNNALKKSSFFNEQYFEQQAMNLVA